MSTIIVRDVSGCNKDVYYLILKNKRKIYKIEDEKELKLIKYIGEGFRWYDKNELSNHLKNGYEMINDLDNI